MRKYSVNILNFSILFVILFFVSCSGNTDTELLDDGKLHISVDNAYIEANGTDRVTFKVRLGNKDVSDSETMNLILIKDNEDNKSFGLGVNVFSTTLPGTYVFKARYYESKEYISEETVTVIAKSVPTKSGYFHKMLGMQFTSTGCVGCPLLGTVVKELKETYPNRIAFASFHINFKGNDPMNLDVSGKYLNKVFNNAIGLPDFFFNMRNGTRMINIKSDIENELAYELKNYPTLCGVAIESSYDPITRNLSVTAKLKSDVTSNYRCLMFLVEDGLVYPQANAANDYVHNNVVRQLLNANTSLYGDKISGEVQANVEKTITQSCTLNSLWNANNMRVIVAMLTTLDGGKTYTCTNTNECNVGSSVDYLYDK